MIDAEELRHRALDTQAMLDEMEYLKTPTFLEQAKLYKELGYGGGSTQIQENKVWILTSWKVECSNTTYAIFSSPEKAMDYSINLGLVKNLWVPTSSGGFECYHPPDDDVEYHSIGYHISSISFDPTADEAFREN